MVYCCAGDCKSGSYSGKSYHFPRDKNLRQKWIAWIKCDGWSPGQVRPRPYPTISSNVRQLNGHTVIAGNRVKLPHLQRTRTHEPIHLDTPTDAPAQTPRGLSIIYSGNRRRRTYHSLHFRAIFLETVQLE